MINIRIRAATAHLELTANLTVMTCDCGMKQERLQKDPHRTKWKLEVLQLISVGSSVTLVLL